MNNKSTIKSWNRFSPTNLLVGVELLDSFHEFKFEGYSVKISLPSKKDIPISERLYDDSIHKIKLRRVVCKVVDGKEIPSIYAVYKVDVSIIIQEKISIPKVFFEIQPNLSNHYSETERKSFNTVAEKYHKIAERVFDLWIKVMRWKSNNFSIGRPYIDGFQTGFTELREIATDKDFWYHNQPFELSWNNEITPSTWNEVDLALKNGFNSPIFYDLYFDAIEHCKNGDLQRSLVDAAVAGETFLRIQLAESLPKELNESLKKFIDDANIRQLVEKFFPELLSDKQLLEYKKIKSDLHKLFDARNRILHSGQIKELSISECKKFHTVTKNLISILDGKTS